VLLVIKGGAGPVPPPRRPVSRRPAAMAGPDTPKATAVTRPAGERLGRV